MNNIIRKYIKRGFIITDTEHGITTMHRTVRGSTVLVHIETATGELLSSGEQS